MTLSQVIVEADGGSRGNPGPAGYGAVVFDASRSVLAERKESIGIATNNVAEYRGLIAGLTAAGELGASTVDVRMDSKLVVEQMSGRWKVKHPDMIPLQRRAAELATQFSRVTYTWIPRGENSHADRLANEAMDAAAGIETAAPAPAAPSEEDVGASDRRLSGMDRHHRQADTNVVATSRTDSDVGRSPVLRTRESGAHGTGPRAGCRGSRTLREPRRYRRDRLLTPRQNP